MHNQETFNLIKLTRMMIFRCFSLKLCETIADEIFGLNQTPIVRHRAGSLTVWVAVSQPYFACRKQFYNMIEVAYTKQN